MRIIWNRYLVGALLLAFMSLLLSGCGDYGGNKGAAPTPPVTKTISGFVSYLETGLPLPGATVTAYAIDASGVKSPSPLPGSGFAISDVDGSYTLKIPAGYVGSLMLVAAVPAQAPGKPAKSLALATSTRTLRSLVPASVVSLTVLPPVMLNFATDAVVTFLEQNVTPTSAAAGFSVTGFSSDNIRKATILMETFFGPNFTQAPPPASDAAIQGSSLAQQNLLVSTLALNAVITGPPAAPMTQIVVALTSTGLGSLAGTINAAITRVVTITLAGELPPGFLPSPAISAAITAAGAPVTAPDLTDTTPPTAPGNLAASAAGATKVNLTWSAATDSGTGVSGYTVYRSSSAGAWSLLDTLGKTATSYSDSGALPSTPYQYRVSAFDAGRNSSDFSNVATVTTPAAGSTPPPPPAATTYNITGKVTVNGAPLAGVLLSIAGAGTGSAVSAADGSYAFHVISASYVITPTLAGYQFAPAFRGAAIAGADAIGQDFAGVLDGTAVGTITYPAGSATGDVTYPDGSVTTVVSYPNGVVIGGVTYPPGTVITRVTYPNGAIIAGVSYPAGTVIATVVYPSGAVIGGVTYPGGAVTTVVSYPGGAVVGGVSYPSGLIITRLSYPGGAIVGGVSYPSGTVFTSVTYPTGTVIGGVSYPAGTVVTSVTYPSAVVIGGVSYPAGSVISIVTFPNGGVVGGVSYPAGSVISVVSYPNGTVATRVTYPGAAVVGGVSYPAGTVISTVSYPNGTVITSVTYPGGAVVGGVSYPAGTVITTVTYPSGIVIGAVSYPAGTIMSTVSYPNGTVTSTVQYPDGSIKGGLSFPA